MDNITEFANKSVEELVFSLNGCYVVAFDINKIFKSHGISTVGDLLKLTPEQLEKEIGLSPKHTAATIFTLQSMGITYANDYLKSYEKQSKEEYLELYKKVVADNIIDPVELASLESKQAELGLSDSMVKEVESSYNKAAFFNGTVPSKPRLLTEDSAEGFKTVFNTCLLEVSKDCVQFGKPLPEINEMTSEAAVALFTALDVANYELYYNADKSNYYLFDKDLNELKEDVSYADILRKALDISRDWDFDTNKGLNELHAIISDNILVPVDVSYNFTLPEEVSCLEDADGNSVLQQSLYAIYDIFNFPSELIENNVSAFTGKINASFKCRHYFVCSPETNYENISYSEIEGNMQQLAGIALNNHFKCDHKILFSGIKAERPVVFYTERNRRIDIDENNIETFLETPKEYEKGLNSELVRFAGSSVAREVEYFKQEKTDFMEILSKEPLLKSYVEKRWNTLRQKQFEHDNNSVNVIKEPVLDSSNSVHANILNTFFKNIETQCRGNKSVGNILCHAKNVLKNCSSSEKNIIKSELTTLGIDSQKKLESLLKSKIQGKEKRKIELNYERSR